jgi:hypothetical protein
MARDEQNAIRPDSVPDVDERERSRRREALVFMSHLEAEAERAKQQPAISPSIGGIASAAVGLAALLVAHAISGMTNVELMVFFGLDVLLPLAVLTLNPKAPIMAYGLAIVVYVALLTGYVAI